MNLNFKIVVLDSIYGSFPSHSHFGKKKINYQKASEFNFSENKEDVYLLVAIPGWEWLENSEYWFTKELRHYYTFSNVNLLFELSCEAIQLQENEPLTTSFLNFHKLLKLKEIDPNRVGFISANYAGHDHYEKWAERFTPDFKIKIMLGYNYYLYTYRQAIDQTWMMNNYEANLKSLSSNPNHQRKYFMCLNGAPRWHRKAMVLFLLSENLLEKGIVTYFGEKFGNSFARSVETAKDSELKIKTFSNGDELLKKLDDLNSISPLTLDKVTTLTNTWTSDKTKQVMIPELSCFDQSQLPVSYFEIVMETNATDNRCLYFTEKTIRPLIRFNPFIIAGCPYSLRYLREIGFKTFSPYIDESYDEIESETERMEAIFKEVKRLCSMSEEEMKKMYNDLLPVIYHNFFNFLNNMPEYLDQEIEKNILQHLRNWTAEKRGKAPTQKLKNIFQTS